MIILVWYGMVWYGMVWHEARPEGPIGPEAPSASCHTMPCHAIPVLSYTYIIALLSYFFMIILLYYYLNCIVSCVVQK